MLLLIITMIWYLYCGIFVFVIVTNNNGIVIEIYNAKTIYPLNMMITIYKILLLLYQYYVWNIIKDSVLKNNVSTKYNDIR